MANTEHLKLLLSSLAKFNEWRTEFPQVVVDLAGSDLSGANLAGTDLSGADLSGAALTRANLSKADLSGADLSLADLSGANLSEANLSEADLSEADLSAAFLVRAILNKANLENTILDRAILDLAILTWATLSGAGLSGADLTGAILTGADLTGADLTRATLSGASFQWTLLADTNFKGAVLRSTNFIAVDLSGAVGLADIKHAGPSSIGIDTIYMSKGQIPEVFLKRTGVPDTFISQMKDLVAKTSSSGFYSCFLSYSSQDTAFVKRLFADLINAGIRVWHAGEDMKIGVPFRQRIYDAIGSHDKLLLLLSKDSVESHWVENEVEASLENEHKKGKQDVLFPIAIDKSFGDTDKLWASRLRRQRHIGDFTNWKDDDAYKEAFERLLRDLKADEPS